METEGIIKEIPKVEQHIHIVGAIRPETILWLIEESNIEDGPSSIGEVYELLEFKDFNGFLRSYITIRNCIREEKQFERIIYEILEDEAEQNVMYVEATLSPREHVMRVGLDYCRMMKSIGRGIRKARRDFGVECRLKIDLVRDFGPEIGKKTLEMIWEYDEYVVAIDLGGSEHLYPPKLFKDVYESAREMGLHLTAHAGEVVGSESVWDAINLLKVERVGHAVSAKEDLELINYMRKVGVSVEACPTSNVLTGAVKSIREHPIRLFFNSGVNVTVNSDDPTLFRTRINNEYLRLYRELGFTIHELYQLSLNAVESSFLSAEEKAKLRRRIERQKEKILS